MELTLKYPAQVERTPLHHGAFTSTKEGGEVVKLLLEAGAEPNAVDCMGYTPLHFACQMENYHAINVLARSKADVNAKGPSGFAPLHIVSQSETSILCVDALLRAGASVNVYDEANRSPVDIARERGAYKALKALHDAAGKRGRVKYLFRDEARDLGSSLAREGAPLRQAIPQMLMAVASGLDPRTGDYWAEKPDYRNEAEEKQKEDLLDAKKKMPGAKNWGRLATRKRGKVLEGKFVESMLVALPGPKSKFDLAAKDAAAERKIEEEDAAIAAAEAAKGGAAAHDESFYSQAHAYDAAQSFYGATSMDPANPTVSATWAQSEYNAQEWNTGDAAGGAGAAAAAGGWEGSGYADASGYGQVGDSSGYGDASASGVRAHRRACVPPRAANAPLAHVLRGF